MKKSTLIITLFIVYCSFICAQTENHTSNLYVEGQIIVSANANAFFINLGGPSLRFNFPRSSFGITLFPTFKFEKSASKLVVSPLLGVGPQVCFLKDKRFIIAFPCYYYASKNFWTATVGLGYTFIKPK